MLRLSILLLWQIVSTPRQTSMRGNRNKLWHYLYFFSIICLLQNISFLLLSVSLFLSLSLFLCPFLVKSLSATLIFLDQTHHSFPPIFTFFSSLPFSSPFFLFLLFSPASFSSLLYLPFPSLHLSSHTVSSPFSSLL